LTRVPYRQNVEVHARGQAQQSVPKGYGWCVDLDLEKFFDRVNHDKPMGRIEKHVEDKRLLKLIRAFLNAGVMGERIAQSKRRGDSARRTTFATAKQSRT
jgi:RNA-directed DNA polymerase